MTHQTGRRRHLLHRRDRDGVVGQTPLAEASMAERMMLFTEGPEGPEPAVWDADWADAHARLTDLRGRLGEPVWQAALEAVTDTDRTVIAQLLQGDFDL